MSFVLAKNGLSRGFTFIELFCVIIIIGVAAVVSFPRINNYFNNQELIVFSRDLQAVVNYLCQRAVVERKVIYLEIDEDNEQYWAYDSGGSNMLKKYRIPAGIKVAAGQKRIMFYPDGAVDKINIKLINRDNQAVNLTSKGVFCGAKLEF
jgi:prepilin-type N-terminal cleavage/methylation domain-containing protein